MRFVVFVNGGAGSVDDDVADRIEAALTAAGAEAEVRAVEPDDLADAVVDAWAAGGLDAVLVAGGDGTVNAAAGAAAGTDLVLGTLPLGTFNHFAGDLGLPDDLSEAAAALVNGEVRAIDVGEVNGRVFVNNAVLGLYPELVELRDGLREQRGWGKVRAVPVAGVQVLRRFAAHRLDLQYVDPLHVEPNGSNGPNGSRRGRPARVPLVFVGNGAFEVDGIGIPARSPGGLDDGVLDVAVARSASRWGLIRTAVRVLVGSTDSAPDLDHVAATQLTIRVRAARVRVALDGEVVEMAPPLRYRVRPGELRVLAPAASGARDASAVDPA